MVVGQTSRSNVRNCVLTSLLKVEVNVKVKKQGLIFGAWLVGTTNNIDP